MENYLKRLIFGMPFLVMLDGRDTPMQFVHEEDVVAAIDTILTTGARGAFNLAPPDWLRISDLARETDRRAFRIPSRLVYAAHWLAWKARIKHHESPAGFLYFVRYPWVVAPTRLEGELGFQFRFSSLDTLRHIVQPPAT